MSRASMTAGGPLTRFASIKPSHGGITLKPSHPAVTEARSLFPTTVNSVDHPRFQRILKTGHNQRKLGKVVTKGRWRGFPIYSVTLEERATCPKTCAVWTSCYGNNSPYSQRIKHGPAFEARLWEELAEKQARHPAGFVVRLHILGDFYSADYTELWAEALEAYPALRVFGYTARAPESDIGGVICQMLGAHPERFCVRFSDLNAAEHGSIVVETSEETEHLICPAQTGKTECCATCALCWHSTRTIAFLRH